MTELSEKQRDHLDEDQFAFPKERKEPLNNASHVRNAIARFDQVEGVSDDERDDGVEADQEGRQTSMASRCTRRAGASSARRADRPRNAIDGCMLGPAR